MEDVQVLNLSTGVSVKNINELRQYIKALKQDLDSENASVEQNAETAEELRAAQAALKDALYATTKSVDDQLYSSKLLLAENGQLNGSYNDLVHTLAELKSAWRATTDEAERTALADEIKRVNDKLKELDENTGSFKRNVGNYTNSVVKAFSTMPGPLNNVSKGVQNVSNSLAIMGKQPVIGMVMLIAPVLSKIVAELKENETALAAIKKLMSALEPVFQAAQAIIEKIAGWLSTAIDHLVEMANQSNGAFGKIVAGAVGAGNALLQFLLAPVKSTIEAFKGLGAVIKDVFTGQWKKIKDDAGNALSGIKDAFTKGFDFKGNFELGKQAGEVFINGLGSTRKKAKDTAAGIKADVVEELEETAKLVLLTWEELEARWEAGQREREERLRKRNAVLNELLQQEADLEKQINAEWASDEQATLDEIDSMWAEYMAKRDEDMKKEAARKQAMIDAAYAYAGAVSSILGSIVDMMEASADGSEKYAQQIKNLRIASAIIDTIAGAVKAYTAALALPVGGIPLAIANAAVVTAAGMAQVAKIRNTNISRSSGSASTPTAAAPASTPPPAVPQTAQQSAIVRNAYNTERLNDRMADQRVYILQSDLEASGRQVAVRQAESTF